jgi:hypothetical protein
VLEKALEFHRERYTSSTLTARGVATGTHDHAGRVFEKLHIAHLSLSSLISEQSPDKLEDTIRQAIEVNRCAHSNISEADILRSLDNLFILSTFILHIFIGVSAVCRAALPSPHTHTIGIQNRQRDGDPRHVHPGYEEAPS